MNTDLPPQYPRLVLEPIPIWPVPAVRSTRHPAATLAPRPDERNVAQVAVSLEATPVAMVAAADFAPQHDRLRLLLVRERQVLSEEHPGADTARPADSAPFPLPGHAPRRTVKSLRPDASGRPLTADVAAAIARVTGHPVPSEAPGSARSRLLIVPLGDPVPPAPRQSALIDLRDTTRARARARAGGAYPCPACSTAGVVDLIDHITGNVHLGCPRCFRMWDTTIASSVSSLEAH